MLAMELGIVTILIVVNGLLSMSELAIVSSRPARTPSVLTDKFTSEDDEMSDKLLSHERYGEAFWRAHHEAWRHSELNQREYCEAQGIPLKAFGNWRAKFKAEPGRACFATVPPAPACRPSRHQPRSPAPTGAPLRVVHHWALA